jgi:three-Cys-motif partner protein
MTGADLYTGREQTKAKHFILRTYLQELAFKVLTFSDVTYVDGFSGPWETRTEDFKDSSFMIAIEVLKEAQRNIAERRGIRRNIRCFFCENDPNSFHKLRAAVQPHHKPDEGFEIETHGGNFTDAVPRIAEFIGGSFALIFIDPTGWTGYGFDLIKPLLIPRLTEVLINYMYDFINRAVAMSDANTIASFDPILGGPDWNARLDPELAGRNRGLAVEKLFRETLKKMGNFDYVVSTKIYRPTIDRPHFFLTYGTKGDKGLETFRDTEFKALKQQAADRSAAKERKREEETRSPDMFAGLVSAMHVEQIDDFVRAEKARAGDYILNVLKGGQKTFRELWIAVLQLYVLRVTNVKDVCVALSRDKRIERTWPDSQRKPADSDVIRVKS